MSLSFALPAQHTRTEPRSLLWTDGIIAVVFIIIYAVVIHSFQYRHGMAESDLYRVLVGLLDGANSGQGIASPLHYDRDFGFGYLEAVYLFVSPAILHDPDRLMPLMNDIGFWSMIPGLLLFWYAVRLIHGSFAATIALVVFALGPMNPEMYTSGHQTIPMFAFLCAGATLLFLPLTGWKAVLAAAAAAVLLLAGLVTRGEIFLAFPWLVLSRVDTRSVRSFIVSGFVRSIAPASALVVFLILKYLLQSVVHAELSTAVDTYFQESYASLATIVPGLVYMAVGCGIVTVIAAGITGLYALVGRWVSNPSVPRAGAAEPLGPFALILVPMLFFLPNPVPTRHFEMTLAGMAILIGIVLSRLPGLNRPGLGRVAALGVALAIGMGNQVASAAVRPTLLRINQAHSPYLPLHEAYPTATHADVGLEWRRHATLVDKRAAWNAFGNMVRTSCDPRLVVLSDEVEQIFSRLYAGGAAVRARRIVVPVGPDVKTVAVPASQDIHLALVGKGAPRLPGFVGEVDGKTFVMLEKDHAWPHDPVAAVLADPDLDGYKIVADPYTLSRFDQTPIPADRVARFGCAENGGGP